MPLLRQHEPIDLVRNVIGVATGDGPPGTPHAAPRAETPAAAGRRAPLRTVLAGRRSVRAFTDAALSLDELTNVLDLAERAQLRQWPPADGLSGLRIVAAPYRVEPLEPRYLYLRDSEEGRLAPLREASWLRELRSTYATAPCILLICGAIHRAGAAGYGRLLVRAGALGYAIWLAARTCGLDCSVYASTCRRVTRELRALEHAPRHLFTVALGHAPEAADG